MVLLVKILGVIMVLYGFLIVIKPDTLAKVSDHFKDSKKIYWAAGVKFFAGVLLLFAAGGCAMPWFIKFTGASMMLSSIVCFFLKKEVLAGLIDWLGKKGPEKAFYPGSAFMIIGVLLVLSA